MDRGGEKMIGKTSRTLPLLQVRRWNAAVARTAPLIAAMALLSVCAFGFFRQHSGDACRSNLKQYAVAMLMYVADYDERYPPMQTPAQVQHRVTPYLKNKAVFICPDTGADYLPNPALGFRFAAAMDSPAQFLMLRDAKPHKSEDGKPFWNASYADGHVNQLSAAPALGKAAPPLSTAKERAVQLKLLLSSREFVRAQLRDIDKEIRELETEQRRMNRK
jgi:hypothetical protein